MKLNRKPRRAWLLILIVLPLLFAALTMKPTNHAATRPDHSDPALRTRHYRQAPAAVEKTVIALIPTLRTYGRYWQYTATASGNQSEKIVRAVVPVIVFKDDLVVTLRGDGRGTTLDVTSASRVGQGDFGENRRHILQLLRAVDEKMSAES